MSQRLLYEGIREREKDIEYWKGTDINQFYISCQTNRFCRTDIKLADNERVILNGEYFAYHPKLLWRQTAPYPICAIDYKGIWFGRSIQAGVIKNDYVKNFAWGKLYRADIVKKYQFPKGKYYEDSYWQHLIVHECKRYGVVPVPLYYYRQGT